MRRVRPALVPIAVVAGSMAAHASGALVRAEPAGETAHATTGAGIAPLVIGSALAVLLLLVVARLRSSRALSLASLAAPFLGFAGQEGIERVLRVESSPFGAGHEPTLVLATIALIPVAAAVLLIVRSLAGLVRAVLGSVTGSGAPAAAPGSLVPATVDLRGFPSGFHAVLDRPPRAPPSFRRPILTAAAA